MNNKETIQKFINLRIAGVTLKNISDTLGISMPTAARWNKKYSDELGNLKSKNLDSVNASLTPKIDKYIKFFEKNFDIIQDELKHHHEFILPYNRIIDNSIRVVNVLQKLICLKRTMSQPVSENDLSDALLNSLNDENDITTDENDIRNDISEYAPNT
jgi:hypothetical protein